MKVGDYVRTKDYQNIRSRIGKIIKQDGKYYYLDIDENTQMVWEEDTIIKSSPNIIDLIEVGDYVNGVIVTQSYIDNIKHIAPEIKENNYGIKSIVTKEQFESMEYKVGE